MDPYIGEVRLFGFNYAPAGWRICDGALLTIQQFTALFAILGTTYGGNGTTNFALPDLRGRVPVGTGTGSFDRLGLTGGAETVTLMDAQTPPHSHGLGAKLFARGGSGQAAPSATSVFTNSAVSGKAYGTGTPSVPLAAGELNAVGTGAPHTNMMPSMPMNFCICLNGSFPPRT